MIRGGLENFPPSIAGVVLTASRRPHLLLASAPLNRGGHKCCDKSSSAEKDCLRETRYLKRQASVQSEFKVGYDGGYW